MYENVSNEKLLNMLINANDVCASQETCENLYNEVLLRMNASQQSFAPDVAMCEDCGNSPAMEGCSVCAECGL